MLNIEKYDKYSRKAEESHPLPLQYKPDHPGAQIQVYMLTPSIHVPELLQGELAHSSMLAKAEKEYYFMKSLLNSISIED